MSPSTWLRRGKLMLLGALSFWLPDVLMHAATGYDFFGTEVWVLTAWMPLSFGLAYLAVKRHDGRSALVAPWMLLGVWLLGNLFMMVSASFSGGGFASAGALQDTLLLVLMSVLPPVTFMLSGYDGSLFALFLVTAMGVALWIVEATRRAVFPAAPSPLQ